MDIKGKNILITGANRGIGLGLAEMFAESGAHIHLVNRTADEAVKPALEKLGAASVKVTQLDLSSRSAIDQFLKSIENENVDILVNNAGQLTGGLLESQSLDEIYSLFQVNVTAVVHMTRGILPGMVKRGSGKIINNSSVTGLMHFPCASTYAASKAAVVGFTQSLEAELKGTGVSTLLLFTPGIETRMFQDIPNRYGQHFKLDFGKGIPPRKYAEMIKECIHHDTTTFKPSGFEGLGLMMAQHAPKLFQKVVSLKFKR